MVRFGLVGKELGHSFSARYFEDKFIREGIEGEYALYPIPEISELTALVASIPDLKGLNVTTPYKENVIPLLDRLSPEANEIGAVNVIKIIQESSDRDKFFFEGHNSDWRGFMESILPLTTPAMNKALILGTGGAASAVSYAFRKMNIEPLFVSRSRKNHLPNCITYQELSPEIIGESLIIVNATPLGMFPNIESYPDIPYDALTPHHLCYDLTYNPSVTAFMHKAMKYGAKVKNGYEMLVNQAEISWKIWSDDLII